MRVSSRLATFSAFASLFISISTVHAQNGPAGAGGSRTSPPASQAAAPAATVIAVIDMNEVFKKHVRHNQAIESLKEQRKELEADKQDHLKTFQKKREELTTFNAGSPEYKKLEEQLAHMMSEADVQLGLKNKSLREQEAKLWYNTYMEIYDHIQQFAERNSIDLVIRYSNSEVNPTNIDSVMQGLLARQVVFQNKLEITNFIVERVNRGTPVATGPKKPNSSIPPKNR